MPRPLVFGNGSLLVALDGRHRVRDLCYPRVGYPHHTIDGGIRLGVWRGGQVAWTDDGSWEIEQGYRAGTLIGESRLTHRGLGVRLHLTEAVSPTRAAFVRLIRAEDLGGQGSAVRVFQSHDLKIEQSDVGNTSAFLPQIGALVHYRGYRVFAFGGRGSEASGLHGYACGQRGFGGFEGTWRDADDGELSGHPIAQGSVDSTLSVEIALGGSGALWMVAGRSFEDVEGALAEFDPGAVVREAETYQRDWLQRTERLGLDGLPGTVADFARHSLMVMRTQVDNGGAVLAANDSDILETARAHYSYCWPRDGALVASVFLRAGYPSLAIRFLRFCAGLLTDQHPYFLHKYRPDGALGASWHPWIRGGKAIIPLQADETGLVISALTETVEATDETEFLAETWPVLGRRALDFLSGWVDERGLPRPSWDLWEERYGVSFYSVCVVMRALEDGAGLARRMGDFERQERWTSLSERMRAGMETTLVDEATGRYVRGILVDERGAETLDGTADAAILGGMLRAGVDLGSGAGAATLAWLRERLTVGSAFGGVARYEGDYYFRVPESGPGNAWPITTLWFAQADLRLGERGRAAETLSWCVDRAGATGMLPEQVHPVTGAPLSVSPLTWSHAEFVRTVLDFVK